MTKQQLYGVNERDYLLHIKIGEIKTKIALLDLNYQSNYASRNTELNEDEFIVAIEIQKLIEIKKKDLNKWLKILKRDTNDRIFDSTD